MRKVLATLSFMTILALSAISYGQEMLEEDFETGVRGKCQSSPDSNTGVCKKGSGASAGRAFCVTSSWWETNNCSGS